MPLKEISKFLNTLPLFCCSLNVEGDMDGVSFANHARYSHLHCPLDKVEKWYKAYQLFESLLEEHHVEYRLRAGKNIKENR